TLADLARDTFTALRDGTPLSSRGDVDSAPRSVVVSWTNGAAPAISVLDSGSGVAGAIASAIDRLRPSVQPDLTWGVAIDVITRVEPIEPGTAVRLGTGDGLAFGDGELVLLPAQLTARGWIGPGRVFAPPALDRTYSRPTHRFSSVTAVSSGGNGIPFENGHPATDVGIRSTPEILNESLDRATAYLSSIVDEVGRFIYHVDTATGQMEPSYNLARHAGTLEQLLQLHARNPSDRTRIASERALALLLEQRITVSTSAGQRLEVVAEDGQIRLSAVALAILACLRAAEVLELREALDAARDMASYLVSLQHEDGRYEPHVATVGGVALPGVSPYAPGEADLALIRLHAATREPRWRDAALRNIDYLIRVRDADDAEPPHDHWLMYAIDALYSDPDSGSVPPPHLQKAEQIALSIIESQIREPGLESGGWPAPGGVRTAPVATRAEALFAGHRLFAAMGLADLAKATSDAGRRAVEYLLRVQIRPETAIHRRVPRSFVGGFPSSLDADDVRIDFVQHAAAAIQALQHTLP
ncbi:MAG: hypothetical protein KDC38_11490, partial [Planctomycetes bacterium]|nr:hypothetical protein [Planctomycetota bacterium]